MNDRPCRITELEWFKPGKHGHAKVGFTGCDVFNGRVHCECVPSSHNVLVPFVATEAYSLVDVCGTELALMDNAGELRHDLDLPEGALGAKIDTLFTCGKTLSVHVMQAMGVEKVMSFKEECGK